MATPRRFLLPALVSLVCASAAQAELVVLDNGQFYKVTAYEVIDEQMRLTLAGGGRVTLPLMRIERVVADEVPYRDKKAKALPVIAPAPEPVLPAFSWRFAEGHAVPYTPYGELIFETARRHEINPALVAAVVKTESNFQSRAVSPKGARGLMQLMPATAHRFGLRRSEIHDPKRNLEAGATYLRWLLDRYQPNIELALAAYNAGEGTVDRFRGVPPYRETRNYVKRIYGLLGIGEEGSSPASASVVSAAAGAGAR